MTDLNKFVVPEMRKKSLYVGCGLTNAPQDFRDTCIRMRDVTLKPFFFIRDFAWRNGPRRDINVYKHDMSNVCMVDVFVAILDHPSIGLGMEFERILDRIRAWRKITVFAFAYRETHVSQIVSDALSENRLQPIIRYDSFDEVPVRIVETVYRDILPTQVALPAGATGQ